MMKKICLLVFTICAHVWAQETVTFRCTDGVEHSFTGTLICTEKTEGTIVKHYYSANENSSITYFFVVFVGSGVSEYKTYTFLPKVVNQTMDFEVNSPYQDGKKEYKLMIYEDPDGDWHKTVLERSSNLCMNATENVEQVWSSVTLYFDTNVQMKDFLTVMNSLK